MGVPAFRFAHQLVKEQHMREGPTDERPSLPTRNWVVSQYRHLSVFDLGAISSRRAGASPLVGHIRMLSTRAGFGSWSLLTSHLGIVCDGS